MKIKSKRVIRMVVCLLLSTMVFACSFSAFAVDFSDRVNAYEYLWAYYIYEFLSSIGINVTYQGIVEYTDEVQDTIIDWVINYIADLIEADSQPSNYSIAQWVAPWQAEYDYWGNLKFNSTMLEDMQDFAEWLKHEFSLVDNSTVIINPEYSLGSYNVYNTYQWYRADTISGTVYLNMGYWEYQLADTNILPNYYFIWRDTRYNNRYCVVFFDVSAKSGNITLYTTDDFANSNSALSSYLNATYLATSGGVTGRYYFGIIYDTAYIPSGGSYFEGNYNQLQSFLANMTLETQGDVAVVTTHIVLPEDNPDYAPGDGVTIVDGVPEYSVVTIDNVTVDNLPAVIQPQNVENPEIDQFYDFIPSFIEEAGDSMNFFKQIIFRMPDEVLYCIYSVLAAGVIFGFLRILREH